MTRPQNRRRRRQKLVKGLQVRLILVFLSIASLASLFQVFLLNRSLLDLAASLPRTGDDVLSRLPSLLLQNLLLTLVVLVPAMILVGVHVTHRVAGPTVRFGRWLDAIAAGEDVGPCRIRKQDELQELCDSLNRAFERVRSEAREAARAETESSRLDIEEPLTADVA